MSQPSFRRSLSVPGLLDEVRVCFQAIKDTTAGRGLTLVDCLLSGLAVFGLKYPSRLQFDRGREDELVRSNLRSLYGIQRAPSDSALRERLDGVDPSLLRRAFRRVFHVLQRGKGLEDFLWWAGHYLLSIDGTGHFYSDRVHCEQCCEKHHRDGRVSWYHQLLGAVLVHPEQRVVLPLAPGVKTAESVEEDGTIHRFRYLNGAPLNDAHFEHNFGHGYQHLSTVFACLMMLAFLIDQVQQHCCGLFQAALAKQGRKRYFREKLRGLFFHWLLPDWETLYRALAYGIAPTVPTIYDTS